MLQWWIIFCTSVFAAFLMYYFGILDMVLLGDKTYISMGILGAYFVLSLENLRIHYNPISTDEMVRGSPYDIQWFYSEQLMTLGMIGTVIGFLIMLSTAFVNVDVTSVNDMKDVIGNMAMGMGTALWTTLFGLITATLSRLQLVFLEDA
jgi:hypothetical protein